jgi:ribosome maturation factor RimP
LEKRVALDNRALIQLAWSELEPLLASNGYELVEVEMGGIGSSPVLRLYIDKEGGGIMHEDCSAAARLLNPLLDERESWFGSTYMLEVSSPGLDRPVRKVADFERFVGEKVRIQTYAPVEGKKRMKGTLVGIADGVIQISLEEGGQMGVPLDVLKRANLECVL